jgi:hypothetical protein
VPLLRPEVFNVISILLILGALIATIALSLGSRKDSTAERVKAHEKPEGTPERANK